MSAITSELLNRLRNERPALYDIIVQTDYHMTMVNQMFAETVKFNPTADPFDVLVFVIEQYATDPDLLVPVQQTLIDAAGLELRKPRLTPTQQLSKQIEDLAVASIESSGQLRDDAASRVYDKVQAVEQSLRHDVGDDAVVARLSNAALLTSKQLVELTGLDPAQLSRFHGDELPKYQPRGIKTPRYRASDVLTWLSRQA